MGLSMRQKQPNADKKHGRGSLRRRERVVVRKTARPKTWARIKKHCSPTTGASIELLNSDAVHQIYHRSDSIVEWERHMSGQPKSFKQDPQLLQPIGRSWLLAESGSAVTRLMDLRDDSVSDVGRPSERAHVRAHQMLVGLTNLNFNIAATDVYSDPDGAIRLLWTRDGRNVELVFPSIEDEAPYLYHSDKHNYGVKENPGPEFALKWINWVLDYSLPGNVRAA